MVPRKQVCQSSFEIFLGLETNILTYWSPITQKQQRRSTHYAEIVGYLLIDRACQDVQFREFDSSSEISGDLIYYGVEPKAPRTPLMPEIHNSQNR
jgi:hypothetical protein